MQQGIQQHGQHLKLLDRKYFSTYMYYEQWDQSNKVIRDRALAFTEFADSENRKEEEIENLLLY